MKLSLRIKKSRIDDTFSAIKNLLIDSGKSISLSAEESGKLEGTLKELGYSDLFWSKELIMWPVFFDEYFDENSRDKSIKSSDINICAISFGALMLSKISGIKNSWDVDVSLRAKVEPNVLEMLYKALTTLIWARRENCSWPMFKNSQSNETESGTINQTTVAISTLLNLGFLDQDCIFSNEMNEKQVLKNRFKWLIKSFYWLEKCAIVKNDEILGWDYTEAGKSSTHLAALLPSSFVFDTTQKLLEIIEGLRINVDTEDKELVLRLNRAAIKCIKNLQHHDNNRRGAGFGKNGASRPTIIHTSFAINSIYKDITANCPSIVGDRKAKQIFKALKNNNTAKTYKNGETLLSERQYVDDSVERIKEGLQYILNNKEVLDYSLMLPETFVDSYKIVFNNEETKEVRYLYDNHETFVEALQILTMSNCIRLYEKEFNVFSMKRLKMYKIIDYAYQKLLAREVKEKGYIVYRGRYIELNKKYPIYCIYYTVISLMQLKEIENVLSVYYTKSNDFKKYIRAGGALLVCAIINYLLTYNNQPGIALITSSIIATTITGVGAIYAQRIFESFEE